MQPLFLFPLLARSRSSFRSRSRYRSRFWTVPVSTSIPAASKDAIPLLTDPRQKSSAAANATEELNDEPLRPAFRYQSRIYDPTVVPREHLLDIHITLPVRDLYANSSDLQQEALANERTAKVPIQAVTNISSISSSPAIDYSTLLGVIEVVISGELDESALLDGGSEVVVIRAAFATELGIDVNRHRTMVMETANSAKE